MRENTTPHGITEFINFVIITTYCFCHKQKLSTRGLMIQTQLGDLEIPPPLPPK